MQPLPLLIVVCGAWAATAAMLIVRDRVRHGAPVDVLWLRLAILRHVAEYRDETTAERGHPGPLFYHYIVPLNAALVLFIVLLVNSLR
ncbi:MAG: hypothetical protein PVJ49_13245 [Acidobacteriota bacterium]